MRTEPASIRSVKSPSGSSVYKSSGVRAPSQDLTRQVVELAVAQATRIADLEARPVPRSYVEIADVEVAIPTAQLNFTGIPPDYRHLRLVGLARAEAAATGLKVLARFNADVTASYDHYFAVERNVIATSTPWWYSDDLVAVSYLVLGLVPASNVPASVFGSVEVLIPHYTSAFAYKSYAGYGGYIVALARENIFVQRCHGQWRSTAAISQIRLWLEAAANFAPGTRFTLYGQG